MKSLFLTTLLTLSFSVSANDCKLVNSTDGSTSAVYDLFGEQLSETSDSRQTTVNAWKELGLQGRCWSGKLRCEVVTSSDGKYQALIAHMGISGYKGTFTSAPKNVFFDYTLLSGFHS